MADEELEKRLADLRSDYLAVTGKKADSFFCPILMRDEAVEVCRGHIVNDAFGTSNVWIPQRKDVDNFYGSVAEAGLIDVVKHRNKDIAEILFDKDMRRAHRPHLEFEGERLGFYFPRHDAIPDTHTLLQYAGPIKEGTQNLVVKVPPDRMLEMDGKQIHIVVDRDYRPAVIASMLKAAHLTLFRMFGYEHVFSPTGRYAADILGAFFTQHQTARNVDPATFDSYFLQHENMISPVFFPNDEVMKGTVEDNRFISCFSASDKVFAIGVMVKAGTDSFCVFLPTEHAIDVYFSFLKEPPVAVSAKVTHFDAETGGGVFEIPPGEPMLLRLRQPDPSNI